MKIVCISDTHGQHEGLKLPKGDLIIHAGDVTRNGTFIQTITFLNWFSSLEYEHKIFIAGNHDFFFEKGIIDGFMPMGIHYLNDSGCEINGIKFWGSPVTPWFYDWAFNRQRGEEIRRHWNLIPKDTDVLITHGPVQGIHDKTAGGVNAGCKDLHNYLGCIRPKAHVCGHIHEGYGEKIVGSMRFINASVLNERYELVNEPRVFEI